MSSSVATSVTSILTSLSFIDSLPFTSTSRLSAATLAPHDVWEGQYIREAEEHEQTLFTVNVNDVGDRDGRASPVKVGNGEDGDRINRLRRSLLGRSSSKANNATTGAWQLAKRRGPRRVNGPETVTPLKRRRNNNADKAASPDSVDPWAYLVAARKLLEHYPMQRAKEHVELLYSQYEGLVDAIADLQETLRTPVQEQALTGQEKGSKQVFSEPVDELVELQAEIRREELEIFALKELKADKEKESRELDTRLRSKRIPASSASTFQSRRQAFKPPPGPSSSVSSAKKTQVAAHARSPPASGRKGTFIGKQTPSVVARKIAADAEMVNAKSDRPFDTSGTTIPLVEVSSPSIAGTPRINKGKPTSTVSPPGPAGDDDDDEMTPRKPATLSTSTVPGETPAVQIPEVRPEIEKPKPIIPDEQLERIMVKIVSTLPKSESLKATDVNAILSILSMLAVPPPNNLSSPASSLSSLSLGSSTSVLTPVAHVEYHLLSLYLSVLLSLPTITTCPLELTFRDSAFGGPTAAPEAMLHMNVLKSVLGDSAKRNGWSEDLGTKAIYGLVAKRILRIDRRGREALVCFTL